MYIATTDCCEVREIRDIKSGYHSAPYKTRSPEKVIICVVKEFKDRTRLPLLIFTDALILKHGDRLQKYIVKNKLGEVTVSSKRKNPNTNRTICVWVWAIDWDAVDKQYKKIVDKYRA